MFCLLINTNRLQKDVEIARYVPTRKGRLLVYNGFTFWLKNRLLYGKKQWYCSFKQRTGCWAAINTELQRRGDVIKVLRGDHNHDPPAFYRNEDVADKDFYYIPSGKFGNSVLVYKSIKFWVNNRLKNSISWACSRRKRTGCPCRVITSTSGSFVQQQNMHNHSLRKFKGFGDDFQTFMSAYNNFD